ncbi:alpha/beta hydrolase [Nocardioides albidus]|uniref:Alpha/beta hydrolase n=1 Tax=Nocardioides albidus TaxID=1517589 RepID=A0A5C4WIL5_9ACTN|nr:alpha/beta fold hydrolase [Nocardioides albidus]TNM47189.1 alpha/beta hydrolase [Nocardioides albidus]
MPITADLLSTAARNAWAISPLGEGVEQYDGLPAAVLSDAPHRRLVRFDRSTTAPAPRPVLLVPPLAVSARCFDLRPGQSLAAHLLDAGRAAYLVDYGRITFADRAMGFETWVDDILPTAIHAVLADHAAGGEEADGVDLVGWSLGGTLALLAAAAHPTLPIASLTAFGTPIDYTRIPAVQPLVVADRLLGTRAVTAPTAALGGVPRHLVRASYRAMAPRRELTKAVHLAKNILDTEALARTGAVDDFIGEMPGYPGRAYHQIHTRLMVRNELASGVVHLSRKRAVRLADVRTSVLFVGSDTDTIANEPAVRAGVDVVPGARYAAADGLSHLGLVAGPRAAEVSWPLLDAFLGQDHAALGDRS